MGTITTLRPVSTTSGSGWTPSAGTLHGVTSDDSDATYATWSGAGSELVLATPADAPPAGEKRHQVRLRVRGEDGDAWWAVQTSNGILTAGASAQFATSPETITGSWGFGAPVDGSTVLYAYVSGQSTGVRVTECYLDMDSRLAPTFTPQVLDGSGTPTATVADTAQPIVRADGTDLDDLNARQYRYWVTLNGAIVWDTGVVSGPAVDRQTAALDNGSYVAHLMVWSTVGADTAYASDEETLAFTVTVGQVAAPGNPSATQEPGTPFYTVEACVPYVGDLDGAVGFVEIQRVDCPVGGYLDLPGAIGSNATTPNTIPGTSIGISTGDFEVDVSGWTTTGGSSAHSTAQAHTGTGSALMTVGAGPPPQTYIRPTDPNWPAVTPGRSYRATSWVRSATALGVAGCSIDWFDVGMAYISTDSLSTSTLADVWTELTVTAVAPAGAVYAAYGPVVVAGTGVGVYVDTVTLEDVTQETLEVTVTAWRDDDWRPTGDDVLISHYDTGGDNRGWRVYLDSDGDGDESMIGRPSIGWSPDGIAEPFARATRRAPIDPFGVVRLKVTLDPDDGLGNNVATFYTRETDDAEWVILGDPVTQAFTSAIYNNAAPYAVGSSFVAGVAADRFTGRIYSAQVNASIGGTAWLSPDFTTHLDGTREFTDAQGNVWTVNGSAAIHSPSQVTTVAILGPLATDECAQFTDFTLPRSGQGATCDHPGFECCSYYRARTVGREAGDLRISNWSDVYDPGIPRGIIMMWPSTAASLPDGWDRVTALDGKYPKGVASTITQPGTTGGSATHTHVVPTHTHDTSHSHTMTGNSGTATGTASSHDGSAGTTVALSTHTHTRSALNNQAVASGATAPSTNAVANDPARLEVIFAESDGTPLGLPENSLAFSRDTSLSGWADYASGADRFVKGAAAAGDGGTTAASTLDGHNHTIGAHTHTGTSHNHTSPNTGAFASDRSLFAGAQSLLWTTSHSHPVSVGSATSGSLASGGADVASTNPGNNPPYRNLRIRENISGAPSLPVGLICAWRGSLGSIPQNWKLCDGTEGTADLIGRYPRGATTSIEDIGGGSGGHTHSTPTHTHTTSGHQHTTSVTSASAATANVSATVTVTVVTGTHTHSSTDSNSSTPTVGSSNSGTLDNQVPEPVHEEVAFVQLMEEPTPPPTPDTICLTWSDDEHLIRTNGPDGPMWAPIWGDFEWSVDRPFTTAVGVNGTRFVTTGAPGGRNMVMTAAVESDEELARLYAILSRPLVLISPSDGEEVWAAPVSQSVKVIKVGRIRQVTASFIGTGPEPVPQLADVAV